MLNKNGIIYLLWKTARKSLGNTSYTQKETLKVWDNELKKVTQEKKIAYRRWWNTKLIQDKINYRRLSSAAKREAGKRKRHSWEKFISWKEYDLGKPRPNTNFWNIWTKTSENPKI